MYKSHETLNDVKKVIYMELEPSGKAMNIEVASRNGILPVINDGLLVGWLEHIHIILR